MFLDLPYDVTFQYLLAAFSPNLYVSLSSLFVHPTNQRYA